MKGESMLRLIKHFVALLIMLGASADSWANTLQQAPLALPERANYIVTGDEYGMLPIVLLAGAITIFIWFLTQPLDRKL